MGEWRGGAGRESLWQARHEGSGHVRHAEQEPGRHRHAQLPRGLQLLTLHHQGLDQQAKRAAAVTVCFPPAVASIHTCQRTCSWATWGCSARTSACSALLSAPSSSVPISASRAAMLACKGGRGGGAAAGAEVAQHAWRLAWLLAALRSGRLCSTSVPAAQSCRLQGAQIGSAGTTWAPAGWLAGWLAPLGKSAFWQRGVRRGCSRAPPASCPAPRQSCPAAPAWRRHAWRPPRRAPQARAARRAAARCRWRHWRAAPRAFAARR